MTINKKNFQDEVLPHELFLITRQTTKIRNVLAKNTITDIKLRKAQTSKIIQSGVSFGSWLGNLSKKAVSNVARDNLSGLVSNLASNAINKSERKQSGKGAVRTGKGFTLFISNADMIDIIKIIESSEDSNVLIDGITETVKHEIKKTKRQISSCFVSTFINATSDFFSRKRYKRKRSYESRNRIYR